MDWGCGADPSQLYTQAEERQAGRGPCAEAAAGGPFSAAVGAQQRAARSATVADPSPQAGADSQSGEERIATPGHEPGAAEESPAMERGGAESGASCRWQVGRGGGGR